MIQLTPEQLATKLNNAAASRIVRRDDHYLKAYPHLVRAVRELAPLSEPKIVLLGHAIYGWMPTMIRMGNLQPALRILEEARTQSRAITLEELTDLAKCFATTKGASVVAASKVLHFLNPEVYPIWDSKVAKHVGAKSNGRQAKANYLHYSAILREAVLLPAGAEGCKTIRESLSQNGFDPEISHIRAGELILFLDSAA